MFELLKLLIVGHSHKWEVINVVPCTKERTRARWDRYYLQCTKCGNIKIKDAE